MMQAPCIKRDALPQPAIILLIIANRQGVTRLWPAQPHCIVMSNFTSALPALKVQGYTLHCLPSIPMLLPPLPMRLPSCFAYANNPHRHHNCGNLQGCSLPCLQANRSNILEQKLWLCTADCTCKHCHCSHTSINQFHFPARKLGVFQDCSDFISPFCTVLS